MRDHRRIILIAALTVLLIALAGCGSGSTSGSSTSGSSSGGSAVTVSLKNIAFDPSDITVSVGGTVTFVNNDAVAHNIAGDTWQSGSLDPGKSYAHTFPTAGTFPIRCIIHPSMTGSVTVK